MPRVGPRAHVSPRPAVKVRSGEIDMAGHPPMGSIYSRTFVLKADNIGGYLEYLTKVPAYCNQPISDIRDFCFTPAEDEIRLYENRAPETEPQPAGQPAYKGMFYARRETDELFNFLFIFSNEVPAKVREELLQQCRQIFIGVGIKEEKFRVEIFGLGVTKTVSFKVTCARAEHSEAEKAR